MRVVRDMDTELPWYLQHVLENEDQHGDDGNADSSSNSFPIDDANQRKIFSIRVYKGDFGIPSDASESKEIPSAAARSAEQDTHVSHSYIQTKNTLATSIQREDIDATKHDIHLDPLRSQARFQNDGYPQFLMEGVAEQDTNPFEFKPFTGSIKDLAQQKSFHALNMHHVHSIPHDGDIFLLHWIQWKYVILVLCWIGILCIPVNRRLISRNIKYDEIGEELCDAASTLSGIESEVDVKGKVATTIYSTELPTINGNGNEYLQEGPPNSLSDSHTEKHENADTKVMVSEQIDGSSESYTVQSGRGESKVKIIAQALNTSSLPTTKSAELSILDLDQSENAISSVHTSAISARDMQVLAQVIETQEVFAAQRRKVERELKIEQERFDRSKLKAGNAMKELRECLVSTMIGSNLMLCIIISCIVRFVLCHKDAVHRLSFGHDTNAGTELLDIVYNWFTSDICKCLEVPCTSYDQNTYTSNEAFSTSLLKLIGLPLFSSSIVIGRCIMGCILQILIVGVIHKILRIFHSNALHQIFNFALVSFMAFNTTIGRSLIQLILEVVAFNAACCLVMYWIILALSKSMRRNKVSMGLQIKNLYCDVDHLDDERTQSQSLQDYEMVAGLTSELKPRLLLMSTIGSIVLATR
mmetsp:Transcript_2580/g.3971  ORF Transcript_2580/g.3971 Transcript_2580/m.3971 type:complete len:642 (+) Transcript_2580:142-2067(+)